MGTTILRSDSDKWGQGLKWGQSESRDNLLFHHKKYQMKVFNNFTFRCLEQFSEKIDLHFELVFNKKEIE
jgi:hypothetical protein